MVRGIQERLDPELVEGALDYIQFNEVPLAFEILCDHVVEYNVALTMAEYEEMPLLMEVIEMQKDINAPPFIYLRVLAI